MPTELSPREAVVIGVDGGATKTVGVLAGLCGPSLRRVEVGPTNAHSAGDSVVRANLATLLRALVPDDAARRAVRAVVLGLAGAGRPDDATRLTSLAREVGAPGEVIVTTDARVALAGATHGEPGIIVIAGTGSMSYGRDDDGVEARAGGWGHILDDAGSAYAIGIAGLRALLRQVDHRASPTELAGPLLAALGATTVDEVVPWVATAEKAAVAALAPAILGLAEAGDAAAASIVSEAAGHLVALATATARQLRFSAGAPVVLTGGLIDGDDAYRQRVISGLACALPSFRYAPSQAEPAWGAVLLAREQVQGGANHAD